MRERARERGRALDRRSWAHLENLGNSFCSHLAVDHEVNVGFEMVVT